MTFDTRTSLNCDSRALSGCDRCVLNLLGPCLQTMDEDQLSNIPLQPILAEVRHALEQGGVICLTAEGQVQFMTQRAGQLLSQYFSWSSPDTLPDLLQRWFSCQTVQLSLTNSMASSHSSFEVEQEKQRLTVRLIHNPARKQYVLLMTEKEITPFSIDALELLGLTKRESEVLFWVAKDKSNAEIARVLDCCDGTVRKHLENIYKKLDVQTRIGAVMRALEQLGLLKGGFVSNLS